MIIIFILGIFINAIISGGGPAVIFILLIILFIASKFINFRELIPNFKNKTFSPENQQSSKKYVYDDLKVERIKNMINISKKGIMTLVIVFILVLLLINIIVIVPAGATGVYSLFGKVKDEELRSGLHIINPFASVNKMSVRTEEYTMSAAFSEGRVKGDDSIQALTKEGLNINLDITVLYHLNEDSAADVYKNIGNNYDEKIIRPEIRAIIRDTASIYTAAEIYGEKRNEFTQKIQDSLANNITKRGIGIESVLLRNVTLPTGLTKSIEEKLQADQDTKRMEFVLEKESKEAERKRIQAAGQRDAQKIINESLTDKYLDYLYINELKDRQGTIYVPVNPSTGMPMFKSVQ